LSSCQYARTLVSAAKAVRFLGELAPGDAALRGERRGRVCALAAFFDAGAWRFREYESRLAPAHRTLLGFMTPGEGRRVVVWKLRVFRPKGADVDV
jgi:hypothetical protein